MNKREKEVFQSQINSEKAVLKDIEKQYKQALSDIDDKIAQLMGRNDADLQNVIYQTQYQKQLRTQVQSILEQLQANEFETVSEFLASCYTEGFVGTMYSMHGQGVPLIIPIDQKAVVKAVTLDSKLKEDLYTSLGVDITKLKKTVSGEITRGIAAGQTYQQIARNISNRTKAPLSRVANIVQTESHRIRQAASYDAANAAKSKGADVVKQWDSTLDGDTRPTHRKLDGQIRELDEPFEMDGKKAMYPGEFGDPAEDCRCRCVMLQRAKWALGKDELNTLKDRAKFFGLDKSEDFKTFEKKYIKSAETLENTAKTGIIVTGKYPEYSRLFSTDSVGVRVVKEAQKTNPKFSDGTYEYTNNCQRCVPAWEYRVRGFDVTAQPCKPLGENDSLQTSPFSMWDFNAFDADKSRRVQADREGTGKEKIVEFLTESGDGSRVQIVVYWEYDPMKGHVFSATNNDGKILFVDPQSGSSGKTVEEYFNRVALGETRWLRIDTLELAENRRNEVIKNLYEKSE